MGVKGSKLYRRVFVMDGTDTQADLSLRWTHMSEGTFSHVAVYRDMPVKLMFFSKHDVPATLVLYHVSTDIRGLNSIVHMDTFPVLKNY